MNDLNITTRNSTQQSIPIGMDCKSIQSTDGGSQSVCRKGRNRHECPQVKPENPKTPEASVPNSVTELMPKIFEFMQTIVDKLTGMIAQLSEKLSQQSAASTAQSTPAGPTTTTPAPAPSGSSTSPTLPETGSTGSSTSKTSSLRKTGQFLWKPASDKDGKVAVLLPPNLAGKVQRVQILDKDGKTVLANGHYSGIGNGDREHYRFNKTGSKYPAGSIVDITMKDGSHRQVTIEKPAERLTR